MNVREISASGAVVLWSIGTDFGERLHRELDAIGLSKYAPRQRTADSALVHALEDFAGKSDGLVEPLERRSAGYEVRRILRGKSANEYLPLLKATIVEGGHIELELRGSCALQPQEIAATIQASYDAYRTQITGAAVGKSLVAILDHFGGLRLRDAGGAYWLCADDLDRWERVEAAVSIAANDRSKVKFDLLRTVADERGLMSIKSNLEDEVVRTAARLLEDITSGELGEQALDNRRLQAIALREKVVRYEGILSELLPNLKAACDHAEQAAALGALMTIG